MKGLFLYKPLLGNVLFTTFQFWQMEPWRYRSPFEDILTSLLPWEAAGAS